MNLFNGSFVRVFKAMEVLDVQFTVFLKSLKMVVAYSDGHVKVYQLLDPLELKNWQLQAEFQNVIDTPQLSSSLNFCHCMGIKHWPEIDMGILDELCKQSKLCVENIKESIRMSDIHCKR